MTSINKTFTANYTGTNNSLPIVSESLVHIKMPSVHVALCFSFLASLFTCTISSPDPDPNRFFLIETAEDSSGQEDGSKDYDAGSSDRVEDVSGWEKGCGRPVQRVGARISGGKEATAHSYPWMVRIYG